MRVLLRGGMETWREDQCTSQLSAQPIIVTLLCPRPRTETNLHAHCQRWRARAHLMDGESDISYVRLLFRKMSSSRPRESGPGRIRDRTIRPHVIDILVSSSRISDLRARRYGALSSPAAPRRATASGPLHVRTHSRPLLYTRGGSSRRVTTMWVTVRFRPFILPLICCHLFDDTPQCAPPPRDSI